MLERQVTITNPLGIHARPSALLVQTAERFVCEVFFEKDGLRVNGKSIMGVMMLAAEMGAIVKIIVDGPDEEAAADALSEAFQTRFDDA